jgi:hypothetical protein
MATSSADTPVEQILAVIRQRCRQNRLSAPPANAVIAAIERNRSARISYPDSRMIIVDHCAIELPSRLPTASLRLPVVAFAIAVPELRILAWEAAFAAPTPQVTAALLMKLLIRAADESQAPDTRQLKLNMGRSAGWWNLRRTLRRAGVQRTGRSAVPVPSGRDIPGLIGNYLWDLRLRPNLTHRPEAITSVPEEHILSADDAQQAIAYAAELHNGSLPAAEASVALQQPSALQRMLMELGEIAGTDPEPARQRT